MCTEHRSNEITFLIGNHVVKVHVPVQKFSKRGEKGLSVWEREGERERRREKKRDRERKRERERDRRRERGRIERQTDRERKW